jgi:hypothetical protein
MGFWRCFCCGSVDDVVVPSESAALMGPLLGEVLDPTTNQPLERIE